MTTRYISRRTFGSMLSSLSITAVTGAYAAQPNTMRAVILEKFGGPEVLKLKRIPIPEPDAGQVQIRVAWQVCHRRTP